MEGRGSLEAGALRGYDVGTPRSGAARCESPQGAPSGSGQAAAAQAAAHHAAVQQAQAQQHAVQAQQAQQQAQQAQQQQQQQACALVSRGVLCRPRCMFPPPSRVLRRRAGWGVRLLRFGAGVRTWSSDNGKA